MKRISPIFVAVLIAAALVLASCSPAATTSTTTPPATSGNTTAPPKTTATATPTVASDSPKYGGTLNLMTANDPPDFDEAFTIHFLAITLKLTNEELVTGDWAKGPAGTGQTDWTMLGDNRYDIKTGALAESWQIEKPGHMVLNIRKGVKFGLNNNSEASRLVAGREMTANDIVFSLKRYITEPTAYVRTSAPQMAATAVITAPDKWTVDIQTPPEQFIWVLSYLTDFASIVPPEVVQKYGNMRDWKNSVGTGSFFLTDFVSGSQATFVKNANYWRTDPSGPGKGNQLPYLDGVKILVIPDPSTRVSALRTGKIDWIGGGSLTRDDALSVIQTTPQLKYLKYAPESGNMMYMRTDKAPFNDKRVRQALMMATDFNAISRDLFGGEAQINVFPMTDVSSYKNAYLPLDQAPAEVQELYKYNPDKAKQLLTEAGFPNGFKATIICNSTGGTAADYLSVIAAMWAKAGITLNIDQKENAVYTNLFNARNYEQMIYGLDASTGTYVRCLNFDGAARQNASYVNDPKVQEAKAKMIDAQNVLDEKTADGLNKELMKYVLGEAWVIPYPLGFSYTFWWPWVKNYHGEQTVGFNNMFMWPTYVWEDQNLKQSMKK